MFVGSGSVCGGGLGDGGGSCSLAVGECLFLCVRFFFVISVDIAAFLSAVPTANWWGL